ncbi:MAG: hypothetical protein E7Z91_01260 [Cyanobacteria bacterium SIG30]|nr:hypothetical protein [Cyanobacteria bacterium SIG30]
MTKHSKNILIAILTVFLWTGFCYAETQEQIEQKRQNAQEKIHKLKLLEKIESRKLYKNQQKLEQTQENLSINKEKYQKTTESLQVLRNDLQKALSDYEAQKNSSNKRIVSIYKKQRQNYVEFLLNAQDLNNFLDRLYFENLLMRMDRDKIKASQKKTRNILNLKQKIEIQQRDLNNNIKMMDKQQRNIQIAIDKNEKYIEKLKTDRATWEKAERELAKQSEQLTKFINKNTTNDSQKVTSASGSFLRPVNGRVSSPYGYRTHPIFKRRIFHSGVDLASPAGTPIKAANSGKVIFCGWYGGYGKVVIIDHGKVNGQNTTTLYAHMSAFNTAQGKSVNRGQVIGKVGSTGYSTGPHLHFEVRVNGKTTNPFNYVPR